MKYRLTVERAYGLHVDLCRRRLSKDYLENIPPIELEAETPDAAIQKARRKVLYLSKMSGKPYCDKFSIWGMLFAGSEGKPLWRTQFTTEVPGTHARLKFFEEKRDEQLAPRCG